MAPSEDMGTLDSHLLSPLWHHHRIQEDTDHSVDQWNYGYNPDGQIDLIYWYNRYIFHPSIHLVPLCLLTESWGVCVWGGVLQLQQPTPPDIYIHYTVHITLNFLHLSIIFCYINTMKNRYDLIFTLTKQIPLMSHSVAWSLHSHCIQFPPNKTPPTLKKPGRHAWHTQNIHKHKRH